MSDKFAPVEVARRLKYASTVFRDEGNLAVSKAAKIAATAALAAGSPSIARAIELAFFNKFGTSNGYFEIISEYVRTWSTSVSESYSFTLDETVDEEYLSASEQYEEEVSEEEESSEEEEEEEESSDEVEDDSEEDDAEEEEDDADDEEEEDDADEDEGDDEEDGDEEE